MTINILIKGDKRMKRYDICIIGSGIAGISAAVNCKIRNKNIIIFGNDNLSEKMLRAPRIENYLGFYGISGIELKEKLNEHLKSLDIQVQYKKINTVYAMGDYFSIMQGNEIYEASRVIIATGMEYSKSIENEEKLLGYGVGYCATCDAPLYKNKTVVIVGYNKMAEEEANYISEIAAKVYYVPMYNMDRSTMDNIEIINDEPIKINGEAKVESLSLKNQEIKTDGIFILKDTVAPLQLVPGIEIKDNHINVNRNMETNIQGCYAAGDCIGTPYQYMKAAGEGQTAALNAVSSLNLKKIHADQ